MNLPDKTIPDETPQNAGYTHFLSRLHALLPQLQQQTTSLGDDIKNRPLRYMADMARNGAVRFSAGNALFASFLGQVAGVDLGPAGAMAIQTALTAHTAVLQAAATYNGSSPAATFRMQAAANFLTASLLAGNATKDFMTGDAQSASMMILPVATFSAWGKGHWDLANFLDRLSTLKSQNKPADEIAKDIDNDPLLKKFEKRYNLGYGAADVVAPWKDMPIQQVAETFGTLFSNPTFLTNAQVSSLTTMPFFLAGLSKDALCKKMPFLQKVFKGRPEAYYTGGYATGAAFSLANGDILFGGSQALWALGYESILNREKAPAPISADEYAKLQAFMENPQAVFEVFAETMSSLKGEEALKAWDSVSTQITQLYRSIPAKADKKKAETFAVLEVLAARSPTGANAARESIMALAKEGDALATEKMGRISGLIGKGVREPHPRAGAVQKAIETINKSGFSPA